MEFKTRFRSAELNHVVANKRMNLLLRKLLSCTKHFFNMAAEVSIPQGEEEAVKPQEDRSQIADLSIKIDATHLNDSCVKRPIEEVYKLGFSLNDLYKLSLQFYKKEGELLNLSYKDKIQLVALWKQVSCGKFEESKVPDIGYFDVIGNDRRKAWEVLGDIAPDVAKEKFISILESNSTQFEPFVVTKRREIEAEIERKRLEEEERIRKEEEEQKRRLEEERIRKEEEERIRLALEAEKLRIQEEEALRRKQAEEAEAAKEKPKLVTPHINGNNTGRNIAVASLWTRPKLQEFVNHVKRDASSVLVVGRGETVTVRVPTHEHGSCLFWEFATEFYDVGFGVYFEWENDAATQHDKEQNIAINKEGAVSKQHVVVHENQNNDEVVDKVNIDEVLPVLRRNCHDEVIVGSHLYPGQGTYLLKFDNSYSLMRSKTLYYRVYYTK